MGLFDQWSEAQVLTFRQKVTAAMCNAAIAIQSEAANSLITADAIAGATSITVANGAVYAVNDLIVLGSGLGTSETRKITAIASNVLTVSATTNAHKAGELTMKVLYNSVNRRNYAKLVLNAPETYAPLFANAICANDASLTVQNDGTITDATIQTDVNAVFNALAGTV